MKVYNKPLLSIIIPVYNVEDYIRQCIDSILTQTYREFEIILVDDGSIDKCSSICDEYALADGRVKVIHKENGGLSDARNTGIHKALGEYLLFIDGDDFIEKNSLEKIVKAFKSESYPDILFLNALLYYNDGRILQYGNKLKNEYFNGKSKDFVLKQLSSRGQFHVSACLKAVKRTLILKNHIFFEKGIVGEDVDYSIKLYLIADTYSYLDIIYYYYRQERTGSIMASNDSKRFYDLMYIIAKWEEMSRTDYIEYQYLILRFLYHQYYVLMLLYRITDSELKTKAVKSEIKRFSYILKIMNNKKATLLYIAFKILGIGFVSFLINTYER